VLYHIHYKDNDNKIQDKSGRSYEPEQLLSLPAHLLLPLHQMTTAESFYSTKHKELLITNCNTCFKTITPGLQANCQLSSYNSRFALYYKYYYNRFTALLNFICDYPGELVPER